AALASSEYFLLMASPEAARSKWVQQEVRWWLANRSISKLFIILTDGDAQWNDTANDFDWSCTSALPDDLRGKFKQEPLYVNLRWAKGKEQLSLRHSQFRSAALDIAAPLLGKPKDELDGEDVRRYRGARRLATGGIATLIVLLLLSIYASWYALNQLRDTYFAQASTLRESLDPVRRFRSLDLLAKAAKLRWTTLRVAVGNDLRDEAVAAMAHVGLQNPRVWNGYPLGSKGIGFNSNLERYARGDAQGNISIRRILDDKELMHAPGFGSDPWVLRFSPDDRYLAAKYDGDQLKDQLYVWDLSRPGVDAKYLGKTCGSAFDFDPNSQVLAVGRCDGSGSIDIFDLASASSMPSKRL